MPYLRLTMVKGLNMKYPEKYAKLISLAEPSFIESKGFMQVGESQERLPRSGMPTHNEVVDFAHNLSELTGYRFRDDVPQSCVALLSKN